MKKKRAIEGKRDYYRKEKDFGWGRGLGGKKGEKGRLSKKNPYGGKKTGDRDPKV